jgi:uncharacterized Ntn-hydrolase superfamily protein
MGRFLYILAATGAVSVGCGRGDSRPPAAAAPAPVTLAAQRPAEKIATFSIIAVDPQSGICGAAVASMYPAVGKVVPFAKGGVGAFCTQHFHHPEFGRRALALLAADKAPHDVLAELLRDDRGAGGRQLAIIDRHGRTAQHQPHAAGDRSLWWGAASGRFYACQGNTLTGGAVIAAMAAAYEATDSSLADRLMAALVAGDCAGGDHRGRLAAGIVVDRPGGDAPWLALYVDKSDDAVLDLARQYVALEHEATGAWARSNIPWKQPCPQRPVPMAPAPRDP